MWAGRSGTPYLGVSVSRTMQLDSRWSMDIINRNTRATGILCADSALAMERSRIPAYKHPGALKYHDEGDGAWKSGRTTTKVTRKEERRCEVIQGTETEYEAGGKNSWAGLLGARRK